MHSFSEMPKKVLSLLFTKQMLNPFMISIFWLQKSQNKSFPCEKSVFTLRDCVLNSEIFFNPQQICGTRPEALTVLKQVAFSGCVVFLRAAGDATCVEIFASCICGLPLQFIQYASLLSGGVVGTQTSSASVSSSSSSSSENPEYCILRWCVGCMSPLFCFTGSDSPDK